MRKIEFSDAYILSISAIGFLLFFLLPKYGLYLFSNHFSNIRYISVGLILLVYICSFISLFIAPRYINRIYQEKSRLRFLLAIIISLLSFAPIIVTLGAWLNYA